MRDRFFLLAATTCLLAFLGGCDGGDVEMPPGPPDTTPPSLTITAPAEGALISGPITIRAIATDVGGVDRVVFLVEGDEVFTDTSAPWEYEWDPGEAFGGSVALSVQAFDRAGNSAVATVAVQVPQTVRLVNRALETMRLVVGGEARTVLPSASTAFAVLPGVSSITYEASLDIASHPKVSRSPACSSFPDRGVWDETVYVSPPVTYHGVKVPADFFWLQVNLSRPYLDWSISVFYQGDYGHDCYKSEDLGDSTSINVGYLPAEGAGVVFIRIRYSGATAIYHRPINLSGQPDQRVVITVP